MASSLDRIEQGLPDLLTNAFFQYGVYEGVPRILDLMAAGSLSSFMIWPQVEKALDPGARNRSARPRGRSPRKDLGKQLLPRPRCRTAAHQPTVWESIQKITGQQPIGWNAYWMRNSPRTLDILQSLGFQYHIDEPSMDEPFIVRLKGGDFVTVPYTFHMNDIVSFPFENYNPAAYEQALKDEFDQLYEEGAHRRRMMVVSLHDRISGHANRVRVLDRFLAYARSKPGVWFARKDEIAKWATEQRTITPIFDRGAPTVSGLPGSTT